MVIPTKENNKPNHLPKINPANKANGVPNPAAKTHKVENRIKRRQYKAGDYACYFFISA